MVCPGAESAQWQGEPGRLWLPLDGAAAGPDQEPGDKDFQSVQVSGGAGDGMRAGVHVGCLCREAWTM